MLKGKHKGKVRSLCFFEQDRYIVSCGDGEDEMHVWDLDADELWVYDLPGHE